MFDAESFDRRRGITLQEVEEDTIPLTLDEIANVSVAVTDEEMTLEIADFQTQILTPAAEAVAQKIDGELGEALTEAAISEGQMASRGSDRANSVFREARAIVSRNKLPISERYAVLSPEATSEALGDELLIAVDKSGSTDGLRNAILGRLLGFETYESADDRRSRSGRRRRRDGRCRVPPLGGHARRPPAAGAERRRCGAGGGHELQGPVAARRVRLQQHVQAGRGVAGRALRHRQDPSGGRGRSRLRRLRLVTPVRRVARNGRPARLVGEEGASGLRDCR